MINDCKANSVDLEPKSPRPDGAMTPEEHTPSARRSQATELLQLCERLEFFHSDEGEAYATLKRGDHRETWPLRSREFQIGRAHV